MEGPLTSVVPTHAELRAEMARAAAGEALERARVARANCGQLLRLSASLRSELRIVRDHLRAQSAL
jgi:hypothetical protein